MKTKLFSLLFAIVAGMSTFVHGAQIWPLIMDSITLSSPNIAPYIVHSFMQDGVNRNIWLWENTYELTIPSGPNCYNTIRNGGYFSAQVSSNTTWSGLGLGISAVDTASLSAVNALVNAIKANPSDYYLHLCIKSTDNAGHYFTCFSLGGGNTTGFKFAVGDYYMGESNGTYIISRDGTWNTILIRMDQYIAPLDTYQSFEGKGMNIFTAGTQPIPGAQLNLDAVFFCDKSMLNYLPKVCTNCSGNWEISGDTLYVRGPENMSYSGGYPWKDEFFTHVVITDGVKHINDRAFYGSYLTSATICDGVTSIGGQAFSGCTYLTSVTIPSSVTSIGAFAFSGCTYLTHVIIPSSVTSIGAGAFLSVPYVVNLSSAEGSPWLATNVVNAIADGMLVYSDTTKAHLLGCIGNVSGDISIPSSVISIGDGAFYNCNGLTSITIPSSVTSIGAGAFSSCSGLTSVTIPSSVTSIGNYAFSGCSGLTSVNIPNSVTSIGDYAFRGCSGLTSINIPNSVTNIGHSVFAGCRSLPVFDNIRYADTYLIGAIDKSLSSYTIRHDTRFIGDDAFSGCSALTSITIPSNVTNIGDGAFDGSGLKSVIWNAVNCNSAPFASIKDSITSFVFGNNVEFVPNYICEGMSRLTSITIPSGVTSIGKYAFRGCTGLTTVLYNAKKCSTYHDYDDYLETIYYPPFDGVGGSITSFVFGNNVESVPDCICKGMSSLTSVTIPDSVTSIGDNAFKNCSGLTSVNVPGRVGSVGNGAFSYCSNLKDVNIEHGVNSIGHFYMTRGRYGSGTGVFEGCSSLASITLPKSVTSIGYYAFKDCSGLREVHISDIAAWCNISYNVLYDADIRYSNPLYYAHHLYLNDTEITDLVIPNSVTSIGKYAFYNCSGLNSVTIGNGMTSIREYVFTGCSGLRTVNFGKAVKIIESNAFSGCTGINAMTCYSMRPPTVNDKAFANLPYSTIIYVPADYLNTYLMHDFWGVYDVRPIGSTSTETNALTVTPQETTATVVWPAVTNAATYELVIKDKQGNVVCTLIFNAQGQLTSIAFAVPSADRSAEQGAQAGFSFTVTGLEEGESYTLTITAKDAGGTVLNTVTQSFVTNGGTGVEEVEGQKSLVESPRKVIENGRVVIILPDGISYDADGRMMK